MWCNLLVLLALYLYYAVSTGSVKAVGPEETVQLSSAIVKFKKKKQTNPGRVTQASITTNPEP